MDNREVFWPQHFLPAFLTQRRQSFDGRIIDQNGEARDRGKHTAVALLQDRLEPY
jgi:hypothetical protein